MLTHTALRIMAQRNVLVDAVYVDVSHEYEAVKRDIEDCWGVIDETGFVPADDYLAPEMKRALQEFCAQDGVFGLYNHTSSWPQALLLKDSQTAKQVIDAIPGVSRILDGRPY
jgi:hypothetical protein